MSLHFANGSDWRGMAPQTVLALIVTGECFAEEGEDCLVTCITRGLTFERDGFHALGRAFDVSVRRYRGGEPIPADVMDRIIAKIEARLGRSGGGQFDVVDERKAGSSLGWTGPHVHVEYQPVPGSRE